MEISKYNITRFLCGRDTLQCKRGFHNYERCRLPHKLLVFRFGNEIRAVIWASVSYWLGSYLPTSETQKPLKYNIAAVHVRFQ